MKIKGKIWGEIPGRILAVCNQGALQMSFLNLRRTEEENLTAGCLDCKKA